MENRAQYGLCTVISMTALCLSCGTTTPSVTQPAATGGPASHVYYIEARSLYTFTVDTGVAPVTSTIAGDGQSFPYFFKKDTLVATQSGFTFPESTLVAIGDTVKDTGFILGTMNVCTRVSRGHPAFHPYIPAFYKKGMTDSVRIAGIDSSAGKLNLSYRSVLYSLSVNDSMLLVDSIRDTNYLPFDTVIPPRITSIQKTTAQKMIRYRGKMNTRYLN